MPVEPNYYRLGSNDLPFYWLFLIPLAKFAVQFEIENLVSPSFESYLLFLIAFCHPKRPFLTASSLFCLVLSYHYYQSGGSFLSSQQQQHNLAVFSFVSLFHAFGLTRLPRKFRLTFTCVENVIIMQLATLALNASLTTLLSNAKRDFCEDLSQTQQINIVLSLLCVAATSTLLVCLLNDRKNGPSLFFLKTCVIIGSVAVTFVIYQQSVHECSLFEWSFDYLTGRSQVKLVHWWLGALSASLVVPFVILPSILNVSTSLRRKFFHAVVLAVLWPGLVYNFNLTQLAAGGTLFLLITAELLKMHRIWPFSSLDKLWQSFTDSKDCGPITLSHVYLLMGCSMPILIGGKIGSGKLPRLSAYSGIISVAVGDSFAAIVGKSLGRNFWPGPNNPRTLEGSFGFILSQIIFLLILQATSSVDLVGNSIALIFNFRLLVTFIFCIPMALVAVVEANCQHFDNIVLPALTFILFRTIEHFIP